MIDYQRNIYTIHVYILTSISQLQFYHATLSCNKTVYATAHVATATNHIKTDSNDADDDTLASCLVQF